MAGSLGGAVEAAREDEDDDEAIAEIADTFLFFVDLFSSSRACPSCSEALIAASMSNSKLFIGEGSEMKLDKIYKKGSRKRENILRSSEGGNIL